jgi:hypothetical protein
MSEYQYQPLTEDESYYLAFSDALFDVVGCFYEADKNEEVKEIMDKLIDNGDMELTLEELEAMYNKLADIEGVYHLYGVNKADDDELESLSDTNESCNQYYGKTCYLSYAYGDGEERWGEADEMESMEQIYNERGTEREINLMRMMLVRQINFGRSNL